MEKKTKLILIKFFIKELVKIKRVYFLVFLFTIVKGIFSLLPPMILMNVLDTAIPNKSLKLLFSYIVFYGISIIVDALICSLLNFSYASIGKNLFISYQSQCIDHLYNLSGNYYTNKDSGDLMVVIDSDIRVIKEVASTTIFSFLTDSIVSIFMLIYLLYLQVDLFIAIALIFPIIAFTQSKFKTIVLKYSVKARESNSALSKILQDVVSNVMTHILSNAHNYIINKYKKISEKSIKMENNMVMLYSFNSSVLGIVSSLLSIIILGYGGFKVIVGTLSIGGLMAFNLYAQKLIGPVMRVSNVNVQLQSFFVSLDKIFRFLEEKENVNLELKETAEFKRLQGNIKIENISFSYDEKEILKNVSLDLIPNSVNAIVGESGMGKSTITYLLYRLWNIKSGKIKIDGVDINKFNIEELRDQIGIVSQNTYILDDTIYNNLVLGKKEIGRDYVETICKCACMHDFIMSLPDKYETVTGENGIKLSGGQRQRLAIARILLRNVPILIFDEATSALDQITEQNIYDNIKSVIFNKTVIIITHRLSMVENADKIHVLRQGIIVENGTHQNLILKKGYYYNLYNRLNCAVNSP